MRLPGLVGDREIRQEVHLPMLHRERAIGVLSLGRSADEEFTQAEIARLEILVESATLACAEALSCAASRSSRRARVGDGFHRPGHRPVDLSDRITYINRAALEQTGWTGAEVLAGTRTPDAPHPSGRHALPGRGVPAAAGGQRRRRGQAQRRGVLAQGRSRFPVEASGYPIRDGDTLIRLGSSRSTTSATAGWPMHQLAAQYQTARVLAEAES